jgi:hypothetical protein
MIAVLLLATIAGALPGWQAPAFPASRPIAPHVHPAGCHSPESTAPASPSPVPTSYQCCMSGHNAAIPNASFTLRSGIAQLWALTSVDGPSLDFVSSLTLDKLLAPSNSPPSAAPLRV